MSWRGLGILKRKWTGNEDRGGGLRLGTLQGAMGSSPGASGDWGLNFQEVTPSKGEDKQTLPDSPSLRTRQEGTPVALRQPVLWLVDLESIQSTQPFLFVSFTTPFSYSPLFHRSLLNVNNLVLVRIWEIKGQLCVYLWEHLEKGRKAFPWGGHSCGGFSHRGAGGVRWQWGSNLEPQRWLGQDGFVVHLSNWEVQRLPCGMEPHKKWDFLSSEKMKAWTTVIWIWKGKPDLILNHNLVRSGRLGICIWHAL